MEWPSALPDPTSWERHVALAAIVGLAALALLVQSVVGLTGQVRTRQLMNRRLRFAEKTESVGELIVELRRQRALDEDGKFVLAIQWFNRLVTRSGLPFQPVRWMLASAVLAAGGGAVVYWRTEMLAAAGAMMAALFVGAPLLTLVMLAGKRAKKLAQQLPDALQIVVRSLEAGHPVPSAIALVAREMPDPIGSEFGMAADEMAYGVSLTDAVERLAFRAGDPDVDLFAATVRLQERTGGNLCDLLSTNAETIRERQTLRLKVKAASAEGRASAMILTAAPFVVMGAIHLLRPQFYGLVADEPLFRHSLIGFGVWMLIGNVIMNRMINFRF